MIIWNLICPKCMYKMRYKVDVCPCLASQIELPKCPKCGEKMTYNINKKRFR
ncbi:hypothetical protein ACPB8Q_01105 [Methanocaldococcus indicus]|uniref:hypothetical protein n=1 Tax=Methanocaldococcus indicus TaxID=213231 RepID=UPI003C6CF826